jgi:hypothetical protein
MNTTSNLCSLAKTGAVALALAMLLGSPTASFAGKDRTKPTAPGNFRVTARTAYTISLAWSPSTDNSGSFNYYLWGAYHVGPTVILPKSATSYTFTGLYPGNDYHFGLYAKDSSGNASAQVTLSTRTLLDTTPPSTAPVLSVTGVEATYVSLAWTPAQDDGPLSYAVFVNGAFYPGGGSTNLSTIIHSLEPQTTYTIHVRGCDSGNNCSPLSNPVTVTTKPPNLNDTTPPTMPGNLTDNGMAFQDGETWLFWQQSTDDFDPQSLIRYDIYANGILDHSLFGGSMTILYGNPGVPNTYQVIAVDTTGNQSVPATLTTP